MKPSEYIGGDRRGRKAHDLELEAMRDPFLADALEGIENTEGDHAAAVGELRQRIASRAAALEKQQSRIGTHIAPGKPRSGNAAPATSLRRKLWRITAAAAAILIVLTAGLLTLRHLPGSEPPHDPASIAQNRPSPLPDDANPQDSAASPRPPRTQIASAQEPVIARSQTPTDTKTRKGADSGAQAGTAGKTDRTAGSGKEAATGLGWDIDIDKVIVVGYGKQDKKNFTGSTSGTASKTPELPSPIRISGTIDLKRDTTGVLYVVDGKTYDDIAWLAARDVASVSVEKEANRIVIRTKKAEALAQAGIPTSKEFPTRLPVITDEDRLPAHEGMPFEGDEPADLTEKDGLPMPEGTLSEREESAFFTDKDGLPMPESTRSEGEQPAFIAAETMPRFRGGGFDDFRKWVQKRVRKPDVVCQNGIQGRVIATFVIDTTGRLGDIRILRSPDHRLSEEVIRVLQHSPRWEPGRQLDRKVKVKYTLPVDFESRQE